MTFDMIGMALMALMALMVMLVIGGGTTWVYLAGQRDASLRSEAPTGEQAPRDRSRPSAGQKSFAPGRPDRHGRRRELFLGP
jgi:hypothetical protein